MALAKPVLTPVVAIPNQLNRKKFGVGEVVTLSCVITGGTIASFGGAISWRAVSGSGVVTGNDNLGNATYTAGSIGGSAKLEIIRNDTKAAIASVTMNIIAPTGIKFIRGPNMGVLHTNGVAGAGFEAIQHLLPAGVSYQNIEIREGSFKAKATGSYAAEDGRDHATGAWGVGTVANGNVVAGFDTVRSADIAAPYVPGTFEWYIPWQYRVLPAIKANDPPKTIEYITHKQEINALGHVTITKGGITVSANVGDPTVV